MVLGPIWAFAVWGVTKDVNNINNKVTKVVDDFMIIQF